MNALQRNAGIAGYVAAVLLALFVVLNFNAPNTDTTFSDPAKTLAFISGNRWLWRAINIAGLLVAGVSVLFAAGLWSRLREPAPTRATVGLYLALIGLGGYALANLILWKGGVNMAALTTRDQVAANHAWLALHFAARSAVDVGNAFVGAALLLFGWSIIGTKAMPSAIGWVGVLGGILTLVTIIPLSVFLDLASSVVIIIWLAWAGSNLRRTLAR